MISRRFVALLAVAALAVTLGNPWTAGTAVAATPAPEPAPSAVHPQVRVITSMGNFVIELYPDRAPLTVAEFLRYVNEGQYTQTLFHRVIAGFVVQGGGFGVDEIVKPTHAPVVNESGNGLLNKRGWVGLARNSAPHSGNCQFYINLADNAELDPLPVRWGFAVFGRVIDGMDVVDRMGTVPTGPEGIFKSDAPLSHIVIQKIELVGPGGIKPQAALPLAPAPTAAEVQSPN
jgi:peptidyl-prolyl cis-trans isomerase A (cyclophilin A)/peptidyl-prolyl cis-trans isomerase B (cyclophilin B)